MSSLDPLVSVEWLKHALQGAEPPRVLDVRWRLGGPPGVEEFAAGHVPGAAYVDLETELAAHPREDRVGGRHPLPPVETVEALVRRAGVKDGTVVVMDSADGVAAARGWWVLRHAGHPDVRLLDGGWQAWVASGGDVETGPGGPSPVGTFEVHWGSMPVVSAADVAAGGAVLLDARAAARFRGEVEPIDPVAGHIPGAVSAPATDNVDAEGRWVA